MKTKKLIHLLLIFIMSSLIVLSIKFRILYENETLEELLFYAKNGVNNSDNSILISFLLWSVPFIFLLFAVIYILFYGIKNRIKLKILEKHKIIFTLVYFFISLVIICISLNINDYIKNINSTTNIYEEEYVKSSKKLVNFKNKKNLIFITIESLENTLFSKEHGGSWDYEVMSELYDLLNEDDSTYFYANKDNIGMNMITGATWTTSSLVTNSSGVPFKSPLVGNTYSKDDFINGAYTLGDLLKDNGYTNELISAARTNFGGVDIYYKIHGNYNIIDINNNDEEYIGTRKKGPWGLNDNYMFELARKRLEVLSKSGKPFNLTLIGIDTHFPSGYKSYYTLDKYDSKYENVYATESKLIYDFINYVKSKDYYKNTLIVIVGDHLSMSKDFFKGIKKSDRYVYNCYINAGLENKNAKNKKYTALDTYPTIVSALGGEIKGNKLGFGVNLFSDEKTLADRYGISYINKEFNKKSLYYYKNILKLKY